MSKYTAEQVEHASNNNYLHSTVQEMLRDYATHLRERESAKAGVTDEMICRADVAQREFFESTPFTGDSDRLTHESVRAAIEAVAPMLASARVPEREALEAIKRLPARPFPDPVAHSWEAFGRAVMGAFTDAKFIAIRALAAAPKPEEE